jgi:hypothetical protein
MALKPVQELHFGHVPLLFREPTTRTTGDGGCLEIVGIDCGRHWAEIAYGVDIFEPKAKFVSPVNAAFDWPGSL